MEMNNVASLLERFSALNVLVIGETILDCYLEGSSDRLCREAPVPVVTVREQKSAPGGAANVAANIAALGANVAFLSVSGDDPDGQVARSCLQTKGVSAEHLLVQVGRRTLAKRRVLAASQLLVRFDEGDTDPISSEAEEALADRLVRLFPACDAVIIADYGYGVITPRLLSCLTALQQKTPRLLLVDAKDLRKYRPARVTAVKPNYREAASLLNQSGLEGTRARVQQIAAAQERLLDLTGAQIVAVTLDCDGALILEREAPPHRTYSRPTREAQAAGAGDTFLSCFALSLAAGAETSTAAELAAAASEVVVSQTCTTTCSMNELRRQLSGGEKQLRDGQELQSRIAGEKELGRRVVFTNGCFDILHSGHITYLNRAKALGDLLVVGLNTDDSVRRLKGAGRPINSLDDRAAVLAAMSCVDYIVPFAEDTPAELIRAIRPEIFVKGGDYEYETLPEAAVVEEIGGTVQILPYLEDRSTTRIIERIRQTAQQKA